MKTPVDPEVLHIKQERNRHATKAGFALLGIAAIITVLCVVLWLARGNPEAMAVAAIFVGGLGASGGLACVVNISYHGGEALYYHSRYRWELNLRAWDEQQEALQKLNNVMKEKEL